MAAQPAESRLPVWARESMGIAGAAAVAIATAAIVASGPRAELLLRDGDSLVTTLIVRSVASGRPQDWAMSSVLFLPETAILGLLSLVGLGVGGTLLLAGVVNLVALYGALRLAAGARRPGAAPVAGALIALAVFALSAITDASADRDALELASLTLTTTYYSATVIAAVVAVGLARRGLDASRRYLHAGVLAGVAAASVLTNPLFAAWVSVPLAVVLIVVAVIAGAGAQRAARILLLALLAGSAVGFAARIPLGRLIANTGAGYADPSRLLESVAYYGALAAARLAEPAGAVAALIGAALWVWCAAASVVLARRGRLGAAVVAASGWLIPLVVVAGAIVLGTHAARYLQPMAFAPLLGLVVLPEFVRPRWQLAPAVVAGASAIALFLAAVVGIPPLVLAANAPDADLACVVEWTDASGRTGAGQFWTVRLPKAHVADPRSLVQVDHTLNGYAWLVNRDDFAVGEVTFLVLDDASAPFSLPGGQSADAASSVDCGRYTILDFGDQALPLGPQHS